MNVFEQIPRQITTSRDDALVFQVTGVNLSPDGCRTLGIQASAVAGEYAGQCDFWVSTPELERFVDELEAFDRTLDSKPSLSCGWGKTIHFAMRMFRSSMRGMVGVSLELVSKGNNSRWGMNRLLLELELEPVEVIEFVRCFRRVLRDGADWQENGKESSVS